MPYIKSKRKKALDDDSTAKNVGELTYNICKLSDNYIREHGISYQILAEVAGALACSQQEIYRRITSHYEDYKLLLNGEVFHAQKLIEKEEMNVDS